MARTGYGEVLPSGTTGKLVVEVMSTEEFQDVKRWNGQEGMVVRVGWVEWQCSKYISRGPEKADPTETGEYNPGRTRESLCGTIKRRKWASSLYGCSPDGILVYPGSVRGHRVSVPRIGCLKWSWNNQ